MEKTENFRVAVEEMLLLCGTPVGAGSRMLADFYAPFDSTVGERLAASGYEMTARVPSGEFAIDLLGETSFFGAQREAGALRSRLALPLQTGVADGVICLDVNGCGRRAAAQTGFVSLKPTYGSISRYGVVSVVPSGETVSVMARTGADCGRLFGALAGRDLRDPTSVERPRADTARRMHRVARIPALEHGLSEEMHARMDAAEHALQGSGIKVVSVETPMLACAHAAWNVILCAELCKSTARYDGIRFGHRAKCAHTLEEVYVRSRTEGFGALLKYAILYGSWVLTRENYERVYARALRVRTAVASCFSALFSEYDAVMMPAASVAAYTEEWYAAREAPAFCENRYTAPASLCGLPALVAGGIQLLGDMHTEERLLLAAECFAGGGKQ